jgi:ABC-type multidrug transport system ATPase subunit
MGARLIVIACVGTGGSQALPDGRVPLDDVSFKIADGITAALVGSNGAGKTTLLKMVAGEPRPRTAVITATGGLGVIRWERVASTLHTL